MEQLEKPNQKRGFALMNPERQRQIASEGGKAAHREGKAHEWTPEEARAAGRKGGAAAHRRMDRVENDGRDDIL